MRRRRRKLIGKRGRQDVGLKGIGKSKKPCTSTRDTVKTEVSDPMTIVRRRIKAGGDRPWLRSWQTDFSGTGNQKSCISLRWEEKKPQERTRHPTA